MYATYGRESPGWISLFKLVTFSFSFKYPETSIFLVELISQWIPDGEGQGIARDIKKIFSFVKLNLQCGAYFYISAFLNCTKFLTIFVKFWKYIYIFFNIPIYPSPFAVWNSLTNKSYQKNWSFWIFSSKKVTSFSKTLIYISVLHFFVENIQKL